MPTTLKTALIFSAPIGWPTAVIPAAPIASVVLHPRSQALIILSVITLLLAHRLPFRMINPNAEPMPLNCGPPATPLPTPRSYYTISSSLVSQSS